MNQTCAHPVATALKRLVTGTACSMLTLSFIALAGLPTRPALADETCQSPYMPMITGQEEFVYVWTLGVAGMGDGSDKLVNDRRPPRLGDLRQSHQLRFGRRQA